MREKPCYGKGSETLRRYPVFILLLAMALTCGHTVCGQPVPITIAISKASPNYVNWLKRSDPGVVTLDLYKLKVADAVEKLAGCSALLVTGGEDVFPGRYGKITDTSRCTEMNPYRDSLEIALIQAALARKMPVAGVCRGEQIINVALGGTLVIDLPADVGKKVTHQCDDYLHCFHGVRVMTGRLLSAICRVDSGTVTTNHHQAVERLAPGLAAGAFSGDGIVESIEWEKPGGKSFLVAVQWHPERMEASNSLSGPLADEFLRQAALYSSKN